MHLSQSRLPKKVVIGVSKEPCWPCELFYEGMNELIENMEFVMDEGHRKPYPGWIFSGISELDGYVSKNAWKYLDKTMQSVRHLERRDFVPGARDTHASRSPTRGAQAFIGRLR
jgi:OTT_1508-like deaminase